MQFSLKSRSALAAQLLVNVSAKLQLNFLHSISPFYFVISTGYIQS
jgi:hypothetical protein